MGVNMCCLKQRKATSTVTPLDIVEEKKPLAQCIPTSKFLRTEEDLINDGMVCAICLSVLRNPVRDPCGHVFGQDCIHHWLTQNPTCPFTQNPLTLEQLIPDAELLLRIEKEEHAPDFIIIKRASSPMQQQILTQAQTSSDTQQVIAIQEVRE